MGRTASSLENLHISRNDKSGNERTIATTMWTKQGRTHIVSEEPIRLWRLERLVRHAVPRPVATDKETAWRQLELLRLEAVASAQSLNQLGLAELVFEARPR